MGGAFQTSRDIFTSDIWQNPVEFRLFFFIYGNAVFSEEGQRKGEVLVKRGQFLRSYRNLQKDLQYIENRSIKQYSLSRIKRAVDRLVKENRLKVEDTELGTLFTVVNYEVYQGFENYKKGNMERRENADGTETERSWNNNKNVNKVKNEKNNNKRLVFDESHMKLAALLWKCIQAHSPNLKKPNLDKWANTFRLMMERDGREGKEIQNMIVWSTNHHFWYQNILSPDKLRKQYDRLAVQKNEEERKEWKNGSQQHGQSFGGNIEEASGKVSPIFGNRVGRLRKKG